MRPIALRARSPLDWEIAACGSFLLIPFRNPCNLQDGFGASTGRTIGQVLCKCSSVMGCKTFKRARNQYLCSSVTTIRWLMKVCRFKPEILLICSSKYQTKGIDNCRLASIVLANQSGKSWVKVKDECMVARAEEAEILNLYFRYIQSPAPLVSAASDRSIVMEKRDHIYA
ncbi:hypothetical protein GALL_117600 [mine drainage metagenome]|uniref:Uncharacterized protein n=1 Tax=mine drainage metagenome TaxID=410659 RepID=A0A1J5SDF3_9ZZZZ